MDYLAADRATGHGAYADLALVDEAGLLEEKHRPLWEAMRSSVSGREGGRLWAISIRGDGPMFAELLTSESPGHVSTEYAAEPNARLDDPVAWQAANPALGTLKRVDYMEDKAQTAPNTCLLYTSPSPRDRQKSRMPSSA